MRPTASSLLLKCRWSTAPRRHSQPEMVASGVMNKKHTMSPKRVRFSCWGPGFLSHCRQNADRASVSKGSTRGPRRAACLWNMGLPLWEGQTETTCRTGPWLSLESSHLKLSLLLRHTSSHTYLQHHLFTCRKADLRRGRVSPKCAGKVLPMAVGCWNVSETLFSMQKESHALLITPEHRHCLLVLCILL